MTEQQLAAWEALCEAATPGPWRPVIWPHSGGHAVYSGERNVAIGMQETDTDFVAASRMAVPALIAEVRRLGDLLSSKP